MKTSSASKRRANDTSIEIASLPLRDFVDQFQFLGVPSKVLIRLVMSSKLYETWAEKVVWCPFCERHVLWWTTYISSDVIRRSSAVLARHSRPNPDGRRPHMIRCPGSGKRVAYTPPTVSKVQASVVLAAAMRHIENLTPEQEP